MLPLSEAPAGLASLYYGTTYLLGGDVPAGDGPLNTVFKGPLGATGSALYSAVPPSAAPAVCAAARFGEVRWDPRRVLPWFLFGRVARTITDRLMHVADTRPLFWPLPGWERSSPVSYYDPRCHGQKRIAIEHGRMLGISLCLLYQRVSGQQKRGPG